MFRKISGKLRETRGSLVQGAVAVIILLMFTMLSITSISVMMKKQKLDTAADEIRRIVELDGRYADDETAQAQELLSKNNISASVSCSASGNISLGDSFTVTLSSTGTLGFGGMSGISIPLNAVSEGKSEVYWK